LLLSHLSHNEARPAIALLPRLDDDDEDVLLLLLPLPHFLFTFQRSTEDVRSGLELPHDDDGLPGFLPFLCASHLATESARPGLGLDAKEDGRMMRHGAIVHLGGVGSRPGRSAAAAFAMARSTDDIVDLLDPRNTSDRFDEREMRLPGKNEQIRWASCVLWE
jgi:hypothetical protein